MDNMEAKAKALAERWKAKGVVHFHVTPEPGATGEQVLDAIIAVEEWLDDPVNNLISRLGGEAFLHRDAGHPRSEIVDGRLVRLPLTREQRREDDLGKLLQEAADTLTRFRDELAFLREKKAG